MAEAFLGPAFEIHGGGLDLIFPHHENEVAQSRSAGREFARMWMHNGMLRLAGEKMSKSLGNIVSLQSALQEWGRETVLVYFLGGHWRKPLDYSDAALAQAQAQTFTFRNAFVGEGEPLPASDRSRFDDVLNDDFNTPEALAVLHEWATAGQKDLLRRGLEVFGLESLAELPEAPEPIRKLAEERQQARRARDFERADRLREEIESCRWEVRDAGDDFTLVPLP
jgi:cysteinyl-tRNA synthetase